LLHRAVEAGLPDHLLFKTLWDTGCLEKRLGRQDAALAAMQELSTTRNPYRVRALEYLAKHQEHRQRDYAAALQLTRSALALEDTPELRKRAARLMSRIDRKSPPLFEITSSDEIPAAPARLSGSKRRAARSARPRVQ
jgi:uncharacterized protein